MVQARSLGTMRSDTVACFSYREGSSSPLSTTIIAEDLRPVHYDMTADCGRSAPAIATLYGREECVAPRDVAARLVFRDI